jgi:hypothetical protein
LKTNCITSNGPGDHPRSEEQRRVDCWAVALSAIGKGDSAPEPALAPHCTRFHALPVADSPTSMFELLTASASPSAGSGRCLTERRYVPVVSRADLASGRRNLTRRHSHQARGAAVIRHLSPTGGLNVPDGAREHEGRDRASRPSDSLPARRTQSHPPTCRRCTPDTRRRSIGLHRPSSTDSCTYTGRAHTHRQLGLP